VSEPLRIRVTGAAVFRDRPDVVGFFLRQLSKCPTGIVVEVIGAGAPACMATYWAWHHGWPWVRIDELEVRRAVKDRLWLAFPGHDLHKSPRRVVALINAGGVVRLVRRRGPDRFSSETWSARNGGPVTRVEHGEWDFSGGEPQLVAGSRRRTSYPNAPERVNECASATS
jgi:hypothetical protein